MPWDLEGFDGVIKGTNAIEQMSMRRGARNSRGPYSAARKFQRGIQVKDEKEEY
ncbi:nuclease subunit of the excinuclease complex [Bacillus sp. OxB-1]|nr:nuclease subunit of the excinuclease complex [Bacillus sp. OxB-1]